MAKSSVPKVVDLAAQPDEEYDVDTSDREDHTFNGIMFDLRCVDCLPIECLMVKSIWVRGMLGDMTIFATRGSFRGRHDIPKLWRKLFSGNVTPSNRLVELVLEEPLTLYPGECSGVYVHSARSDDGGLFYDQRRGVTTDGRLQIFPGMAHTNSQPFNSESPWGELFTAWREDRQFVGRISYGISWLTWSPQLHRQFTPSFQSAAAAVLIASRRRDGNCFSTIPPEIIEHILKMLPWDSFEGVEYQPVVRRRSITQAFLRIIPEKLSQCRRTAVAKLSF